MLFCFIILISSIILFSSTTLPFKGLHSCLFTPRSVIDLPFTFNMPSNISISLNPTCCVKLCSIFPKGSAKVICSRYKLGFSAFQLSTFLIVFSNHIVFSFETLVLTVESITIFPLPPILDSIAEITCFPLFSSSLARLIPSFNSPFKYELSKPDNTLKSVILVFGTEYTWTSLSIPLNRHVSCPSR